MILFIYLMGMALTGVVIWRIFQTHNKDYQYVSTEDKIYTAVSVVVLLMAWPGALIAFVLSGTLTVKDPNS